MGRSAERVHDKAPLFRKVNTTAHGVRNRQGGDFRDSRQTATGGDASRLSMGAREQRGLDYTPLFRFLLSKVGQSWDAVLAEALSRLDRPDAIFWLVARHEDEERAYVRTGESSYFSGLKVDDQGLLQRVDPTLGPNSLAPDCKCCTHTFNGVRFTRAFDSCAGGG